MHAFMQCVNKFSAFFMFLPILTNTDYKKIDFSKNRLRELFSKVLNQIHTSHGFMKPLKNPQTIHF